jgi:hypothetical protein
MQIIGKTRAEQARLCKTKPQDLKTVSSCFAPEFYEIPAVNC